MACPEEKYCFGCKKENQPFYNAQPGALQTVCDHCVAKEKEEQRSRRLLELRIIAQNWESLADLFLSLEERIEKLEARRAF